MAVNNAFGTTPEFYGDLTVAGTVSAPSITAPLILTNAITASPGANLTTTVSGIHSVAAASSTHITTGAAFLQSGLAGNVAPAVVLSASNPSGYIWMNANGLSGCEMFVGDDGTGTQTGKIVIVSDRAAADAILIDALSENAAGGLDCNVGSSGMNFSSTGVGVFTAVTSLSFPTQGAVDISSSGGRISASSSVAAADAIRIVADNVGASGIDIDCLGTGTIAIDAAAGAVSLGCGLSGDFTVSGAGQSLSLDVAGGGAQRLFMRSAGTGADAIRIQATNATSGLDVDVGSSGADLTTTGRITFTSSAALGNAVIVQATDAAGGVQFSSGTGGSVYTSTGQHAMDSSLAGASALQFRATDPAGGITQRWGTGGLTLGSVAETGAINMLSDQGILIASTSGNATLESDGLNTNVIVQATGAGTSNVVIACAGTGANAIDIDASSASGGITMDCGTSGLDVASTGQIAFDTTSGLNGAIHLGTGAAGGIELISGLSGIRTNGSTGQFLIDNTSVGINAFSAQVLSGGVDINAGLQIDIATAQAAVNALSLQATAGSFLLRGQGVGAAGLCTVSSDGNSGTDDLLVSAASGTGQLHLRSIGNGASAVLLEAVNGGVDINSGASGVSVNTSGALSLDSTAGVSNLTLTSANGVLTVAQVGGGAAGQVIIDSSGTGVSAVDINSLGGISLDSVTAVSITVTGAAQDVLFNTNGTANKGDNGANWDVISDRRIKCDIQALKTQECFEKIRRLSGIMSKFAYKSQPSVPRTGFIAQDLELHFPQMVDTSPRTIDGVHYPDLKSVRSGDLLYELIAAVSYLNDKIDDLWREVRGMTF